MKKLSILLSICTCLIFQAYSQTTHKTPANVLKAPKSWRSEVIKFPLSFAKSIDFKGVEDIRFAKGWGKQQSEEFWMYSFAWYLDVDPQLDSDKLGKTMEVYFDGLMQAVAQSKKKGITIPLTTALFVEKSANQYIGKIRVYDAFFSKKMITLNIKMSKSFCKAHKKHLFFFKITPKALSDQKNWAKLKEVEVGVSCK